MAAWTSDRQAEVRRLILAGFSHAQIAERLDLSRKEAADLWTEARLTQPWGAR
jgi:DNA-binding CsgD family transcriptional regulator